MKVSVFCGVSVDGFLARPNHALDFLDTPGQGPHGYEEFWSNIDVIVIGRKTYEVVLGFDTWAYGKKQVIVLSSRPLDFSKLKNAVVERMSGEPPKILAKLKARNLQHVYVDGGVTIQRFLAAGVVDRMVVTRVPVLIGKGIPLFGPIPHDIPLQHVRTQTYDGGLVQTEYEFAAAKKRSGPAKRKK